jgi:hypothetical protein
MGQNVTKIQIKEVEDISPHLFSQMKAEYCSALQQYLMQTNTHDGTVKVGPYRAQAVCDLF